MIWNKNRI